MKVFVRTVPGIKHYDVVSRGILADEFRDNGPREWIKQASKTLEEATDSYMVEVIAKSSFQQQQLISCRFATCLLLWRGKEVGYSWDSPTCASL